MEHKILMSPLQKAISTAENAENAQRFAEGGLLFFSAIPSVLGGLNPYCSRVILIVP
jgi:hypothetical protein